MINDHTSIRAPIANELADLLFSSAAPILANLLVTLLATAVLSYERFSSLLLIWCVSNSGVTIARIVLRRRYRQCRQQRVANDPALWMRRNTWLTAATGLHWGALALATALMPDRMSEVLVPLLVFAVSASVASTHSSHLPSIIAYIWPACTLLTLGAAIQADALHSSLALFYVVFLVNLTQVARRSHQAVVDTLQAKLEKQRDQEHLARAQRVAATGSSERDLLTGALEWSDEVYRLIGVDRASFALTDANIFALIHEEDRERVVEAVLLGRKGVSPPPIEFRVRRPDGEIRTLYCETDLTRDDTGKPIRILTVFKDMTELRASEERRREIEEKLMQSQKLEALGTLAGGVAHELNNALVPILALSKVTARRLPENSRERTSLETILKSSERARELVQQILAFSRNQPVQMEPLDVAVIVRETLSMMRASLPTSMTIVEHIATVPPVLGDAHQLARVVVNLMTNAAQAIGETMGVVTVELAVDAGGMACLTIADTGHGMDDATLARIFEPFFTTKGVGSGTGLGLSIVHGIVTAHRGRIEVASRVGEGTRFAIYLPLADLRREPQGEQAA